VGLVAPLLFQGGIELSDLELLEDPLIAARLNPRAEASFQRLHRRPQGQLGPHHCHPPMAVSFL
jgi:hypothetical protein